MATEVRRRRAALFSVLALTVVGCQGVRETGSPSSEPSPMKSLGSYAPSASAASPTATASGTSLRWTEAGSFGEAGAADYASAVTRGASGLVVVGTHFDRRPSIDDIQPPHDGRVWVSADGREWADVTPSGIFADAVLDHVLTTVDGSFIAIGEVADPVPYPIEDFGPPAAWESPDGLEWHRVDIGLPSDQVVQHLEHGARGYLAHSYGSQLWLSPEGRSWERVPVGTTDEQWSSIGAGAEGFVAVGYRVMSETTIAIASSDGRNWIQSSSPPIKASRVVPFGPDWIALAPGFSQDPLKDSETPVWFSSNGLDWSQIGSLPLQAAHVDDSGTICDEVVGGLASVNGWLVASLTLSGPCSEGASVSYSRALISEQGTSWQPLPFGKPSSGERGWTVLAATGTEKGLLLVGFSSGRATFWLGELS